ncbi:MAG: ABC transporter permease subunit [Tissierellia bacterium]|nr:ABC transporter permease subunit [Tissierellia bacterium]
MINYIKSELYRSSRSKGLLYCIVGTFLFVVFAFFVMYVGKTEPVEMFIDYSSLMSGFNMMGHYGILIILSILLASEIKDDCLKNAISSGVNRNAIILGKIISYIAVSLVSFMIIIALLYGVIFFRTGFGVLGDPVVKTVISQTFITLFNGIPLWTADLSFFIFVFFAIKSLSMSSALAALTPLLVPQILSSIIHFVSDGVREAIVLVMNHIPSIMNTGQASKFMSMSNTIDVKYFVVGGIYLLVFTFLTCVVIRKREF